MSKTQSRNAITMGLYGAGDNQSHLRCETVICERATECSLYKEGKCQHITCGFSQSCPFGKLEQIDLGTRRRKAYHMDAQKVKDNELYRALSSPEDNFFYTVGDEVLIGNMSLGIKRDKDGIIKISGTVYFKCGFLAFSKDELTDDLLDDIYNRNPINAFSQWAIESYKTKELPHFFSQIKKNCPDIYERYKAHNPAVEELVPDYVGKYAYIYSLNPDIPIYDNGKWKIDLENNVLICEEYKPFHLAFGGESTYAKMPLTKDMKVKITSNEQVLPTTVFA